MTRQQKTPRQRAEEQLATAERAADRLKTRRDTLLAELADVQDEYDAAVARRDFLANHPDLGQQGPSTTATTTSTGDTL